MKSINKNKVRIPLDIFMTIISIFLMGGIFIFENELIHEILGVLLIVSWAVHVVLNGRFYLSLFNGKYNLRRVLVTSIDLLILLCAILLMISGIMLSNHLFVFLGIENGIWLARIVHLIASHWYYVFMIIHISLHIEKLIRRIIYKGETKKIKKVSTIILCLCSVNGIFAFIRRKLYLYLFYRQPFFMPEDSGIVLFIMDYFCMIVFAGIFTFMIKNFFKR